MVCGNTPAAKAGSRADGELNGECRLWWTTFPSRSFPNGEKSRQKAWVEGTSGTCGRNSIVTAGGKKRRLASKTAVTLRQGDTICIETPGGGGFGKKAKPPENQKIHR